MFKETLSVLGLSRYPHGHDCRYEKLGDPLIDPRGREHPFAVVVTSVTAAKDQVARLRTNREDYDPETFIEETNFEDSYLILIQWFGSSSSDDLELGRIERRENSVHVTAEVIEPCGGTYR